MDHYTNYSHEIPFSDKKKKEWIVNKLIVTPHVAFYSPESLKEMRESAAFEALRVLSNRVPRNRIV